ncbi:MAG: hypothetical protein Q8M92_10970, partial [Candidatus Subteraquimicrobiales bacterium]|nr:hypothetical protein [Candidatus Subteraquimicrobiales bacterium]
MADTITQTQTSEAVLNVLAFLVDNDKIKRDEVAPLREKFPNAEDLIDYFKTQGKIPERILMESYAKAKGIPFVELSLIDEKAFGLIDKNAARQFGFIPFAIDEKSNTIQVAIAQVDRFKNLNTQAVKALEEKLGKKIELFVTTEESAEKVLSGSNSALTPKIDLFKIEIEKNALQKSPYDVAEKYQAVIFRESPDDALEVAAVSPKDKGLLDILGYIEKETGVKIRMFEASSDQIGRVLEKYRMLNE